MKEIIRDLYYGNLRPFESCNANNPSVKPLTNKITEYRENIISNLPLEQQKALNDYDDLVAELYNVYHEEYFIVGFKLGVKLLLGAINE